MMSAILRLAATQPGHDAAVSASDALKARTDAEWAHALATLRLHRIASLAWHGIKAHGLEGIVPGETRGALHGDHRGAAMRNMALFHAWGRIVDALDEAGVHPTYWKGLVFAGCLYPSPAMRSMDDIDMSIRSDEVDRVTSVFEALGFKAVSTTHDAIGYQDAAGTAVDVHHRVRLFEGHAPAAITETARCAAIQGREFVTLNPEAMMTHQVCHAAGHRPGMGYLLRWLVDVHFMLDKFATDLSTPTLKTLLPAPAPAVLLLRILGFLDEHTGTPIPEALRPSVEGVTPLTLDEILRSRRLAVWGLPGPRGIARLVLGRKRTATGELRPDLEHGDLTRWVKDSFHERTATLPREWHDIG